MEVSDSNGGYEVLHEGMKEALRDQVAEVSRMFHDVANPFSPHPFRCPTRVATTVQ